MFVLRISIFLALTKITIATEESSCTLQCNSAVGATCAFATPADSNRYADHPLGFDGEPLEWHKVQQQDGMYCKCPDGWTGLLCDVPFLVCDGHHYCYNRGRCVPDLEGHFGGDELFCNCENAYDEDGNQYVGKYCEQTASEKCDAAGVSFCLNDGTCNHDFK